MRRETIATIALTAVSCFSADSVLGLPCTTDDGCGPGYSCELGRCYEAGDDPKDGCEDGEREPGEFCYGDVPAELPFDGVITGFTWIDVTGDGLLDVMVAVDQDFTLYVQQGNGKFEADDLPDLGQPLGFRENIGTELLRADDVLADDLLGGDAQDLVLILGGGAFMSAAAELIALQRIAVIENNGVGMDGGYTPIAGTRDLSIAPFSLSTGQFGGGEERDIVFLDASGNADGVYLVINNGDGTFGVPTRYETLSSLVPPTVGRINDDEIDDFVAMDGTRKSVSVLYGTPEGGFEPPIRRPVAGTPRGAAVIDIDGDGRNEVVVAHVNGSKASLLRFEEDGSFEAESIDGPASNDIAAADLDGDGLDELVFVGEQEVSFQLTLGGELGVRYQLANSAGNRLDFVDLNGDGTLDLLSQVESRLFTIMANP